MMKEIMTTLSIVLAALLLAGCTTLESSSKPQKDWLFAHIATEAEILNQTTIVMPVTQDIIAFTNGPFVKHADLTGSNLLYYYASPRAKPLKLAPAMLCCHGLTEKAGKKLKLSLLGQR